MPIAVRHGSDSVPVPAPVHDLEVRRITDPAFMAGLQGRNGVGENR
jgi:hypothetical protein